MLAHIFNQVEIQFAETDLSLSHFVIPKGYVNVTQMCKANGKLFADYKRLTSTKAYLEELSNSMGIPIDSMIISVESGQGVTISALGTWAHPDLTLHLAQWLSPKFYVWCNQKLKEVLVGKQPEVKEVDQLELMQILINQAIENRNKQRALEAQNAKNQEELNLLKASVNEQVASQSQHNQYVDAELGRIENAHGTYLSVMGYARLNNLQISVQKAATVGRKASNKCKKLSIPTYKVKDPRFGQVGTYPEYILKSIAH